MGTYKRAVVGPIESSFWNDKFMWLSGCIWFVCNKEIIYVIIYDIYLMTRSFVHYYLFIHFMHMDFPIHSFQMGGLWTSGKFFVRNLY